MIFPNKNTDPNLSIINSIYYIVVFLRDSGQSTIKEIKDYLSNTISEDILPLFEPSIDVLYLLGKVEYNSNLDTLYLVSPVEREEA